MKNTNIITKRLEKEFERKNINISIHNFSYLSGQSYKASFKFNQFKDGSCSTFDVVVKYNETYKKAIERTLNI